MNITEAAQELEIGVYASKEEVKKKFKSLASIYHPDNKASGDADKFKSVFEAYCVFSSSDNGNLTEEELHDFHNNEFSIDYWKKFDNEHFYEVHSCIDPISNKSRNKHYYYAEVMLATIFWSVFCIAVVYFSSNFFLS